MSGGIDWPDELPLPVITYQGSPEHQTLASDIEQARIQRRERFKMAGVSLRVQWIFSIAQYDTFKDFYQEDLGNGAAAFSLELRHPKTSGLTTWKVRFRGAWEAVPIEAMWAVSGALYLIRQEVLEPTPAPPVDWEPFLVVPEESSGSESSGDGYIPFVVQENSPYFVRIL